MLNVTVPCASCGAAVGFPGRACASCGSPLTSALRRALEARLEASDEDFRAARSHARTASTTILMLSLMSAFAAVALYAFETSSSFVSDGERAAAREALGRDMGVVALWLGCYLWSRRQTVAPLAVALAAWLALNAAIALVAPLSLVPFGLLGLVQLLFRIAVLVLLTRGLVAAVRARLLLRKVANPS